MIYRGGMSFLDYHTAGIRNVEPLRPIEDYIANFHNVDWLDAAWFAAIY